MCDERKIERQREKREYFLHFGRGKESAFTANSASLKHFFPFAFTISHGIEKMGVFWKESWLAARLKGMS